MVMFDLGVVLGVPLTPAIATADHSFLARVELFAEVAGISFFAATFADRRICDILDTLALVEATGIVDTEPVLSLTLFVLVRQPLLHVFGHTGEVASGGVETLELLRTDVLFVQTLVLVLAPSSVERQRTLALKVSCEIIRDLGV